MKLYKDNNGISKNSALLLTLVAVLGICGLYYAGIIDISLPTVTDEYEETVNRNAADLGIKIPIDVKLTVVQDPDTGANKATIDVKYEHIQPAIGTGTNANYVPDAELISRSNFNTKVGNVGDDSTIFITNGVEFRASNLTLNQTLTSYEGVQYGYSQDYVKVWTTDSVYEPPAQGTSLTISGHDSNHVIGVQLEVTHCRKATQEIINSYAVTFFTYYKIGDYNEEYTPTPMNYDYFIYIPFDDYAMVEDIYVKFLGYEDACLIQWKTVTTRVREFWGITLFGIDLIGVVHERETTATSNLEYHWDSESGSLDAINVNNDEKYGSHSYTYKIR